MTALTKEQQCAIEALEASMQIAIQTAREAGVPQRMIVAATRLLAEKELKNATDGFGRPPKATYVRKTTRDLSGHYSPCRKCGHSNYRSRHTCAACGLPTEYGKKHG